MNAFWFVCLFAPTEEVCVYSSLPSLFLTSILPLYNQYIYSELPVVGGIS